MAEGPVKADKGREELTGEGALMEAWAVLTDTEEVGGPEEKMDRFGVLKSEDWCTGTWGAARSNSGAGSGSVRGVERREKMVPAAEVSAKRGEGEVLVEFEGKAQVGM